MNCESLEKPSMMQDQEISRIELANMIMLENCRINKPPSPAGFKFMAFMAWYYYILKISHPRASLYEPCDTIGSPWNLGETVATNGRNFLSH